MIGSRRSGSAFLFSCFGFIISLSILRCTVFLNRLTKVFPETYNISEDRIRVFIIDIIFLSFSYELGGYHHPRYPPFYVHFHPSSSELNSKTKTDPYAIGERIETNADLNDFVSPGAYTSIASNVSQTLKNAPYSNAGFRLEVKEITSDSGNSVVQIAYKSNDNVIHIRNQLNSIWKDWTQL